MKLPIEDEYFKLIKYGRKKVEYRDSHITFINKKTKETLRKNVIAVKMIHKSEIPMSILKNIFFEDFNIIEFKLEK